MLIAREKRSNNIAEYILYMWQVEDILRSMDFDRDKIVEQLVSRFQVDEKKKSEIEGWYVNLALMMQKEQITARGHLQFLKNQVDDLNQFHLQLVQNPKGAQYQQLFQLAKPVIDEFRELSKAEAENDIHVALHSLHAIMLLNMQKKEISTETKQAVSHVAKSLAHLSDKYLKYEKGDFEL